MKTVTRYRLMNGTEFESLDLAKCEAQARYSQQLYKICDMLHGATRGKLVELIDRNSHMFEEARKLKADIELEIDEEEEEYGDPL